MRRQETQRKSKIKNLRARAVRVAGVQILIVGLRVPADPENSVNLSSFRGWEHGLLFEKEKPLEAQ